MPVFDCPSGPQPGPQRSATDGALGWSAASALQNAIRDALEEAKDEVRDADYDEYECHDGCELIIGEPFQVGGFQQHGPPRRAWWTLGIAFWAKVTMSAACNVECKPKG